MAIGKYKTNRGLALVIALWMLALLTIMVSGYTATMRTETKLTSQFYRSSISRNYAEAGVWLAINELLKTELNRNITGDGATKLIEYHQGSIEVSIQDEAGKIDLNTGRVELLRGLLVNTGISDARSIELLHAILDWRDRDDTTRAAGAEDRDYASAGYDYGAKDGAFNSIEELRLVKGMDEDIFQKMLPSLTIFSQQPGINPEFASRETLMTLPNITEAIVDEFLLNRELQLDEKINSIAGRYANKVSDRSLTITSKGINSDNEVTLQVVVNMTRNIQMPYRILSWKEI